jgi:hypothetical protein
MRLLARTGYPEAKASLRRGAANLFVFFDAHRSWRHVKVTDQRTAQDSAACMRDLADIHYPDADQIRVVPDDLSTHTAGALYETFPASEAHRILQRLECHYAPKRASWLNKVEIEIGVSRVHRLDRRIGDRAVRNTEVAAWERQRNASGARINGRSRRRRRGRSWPAPILTPRKGYNHCDEVLGRPRLAPYAETNAAPSSASKLPCHPGT